MFHINAVLTFYSSKNAEKMYHDCHTTTVFSIDNNKCFLSRKSQYQNDFWRITWHCRLEYWCWKNIFSNRK